MHLALVFLKKHSYGLVGQRMDLKAIIKELRQERERVEEAIIALERVKIQRGKRRGRPPDWLKAISARIAEIPKRRGRPPKHVASR